MNTTIRISLVIAIVVAVLGGDPITWADPMGTAFLYQGRLVDSNDAADGLYDLNFKLYDAAADGNELHEVVIGELELIDGYFSVALDFGSTVFDGNGRWLQVGIRVGELSDPNEYTILDPRLSVTPTPYALYAASGTPGPQGRQGEQGIQGIQGLKGDKGDKGDQGLQGLQGIQGLKGDTGPQGLPGDSHWQLNGMTTYYNAGKVGIGTTAPQEKLEVRSASGEAVINVNSGMNFMSSVRFIENGSRKWLLGHSPALGGGFRIYDYAGIPGERFYIEDGTGNVGIGTTTPGAKLEVNGQVKITGGSPGSGKVLTSDATGLGSWKTVASLGHNHFGEHWSGFDFEGLKITNSREGGAAFEGIGTASTGASWGGYFLANSSPDGIGVYASGKKRGVYGLTASTSGEGVRGWAQATSGTTYGGYFRSDSPSGTGVFGQATIGEIGVCGSSGANSGRGVYGISGGSNGYGVYGYADNTGDVENYGGYFKANGIGGRGAVGRALGTGGQGLRGEAPVGNGIGVFGSGQQWDFYAANGKYGYPSSIRFKRDMREIDEPLGKIIRLRGVYFKWDEEHGGRHDVGMIAEEVGQVLPEIVTYEDNGVDAMGMDYGKLTPLLVEAVKALKSELDHTRQRLADRDSAMTKMKKRLAAMELQQVELADLQGRISKLESVLSNTAGFAQGGSK